MTANGVHIPRVLSADETSEVEKLVACWRYKEAAEMFGGRVTYAQEQRDILPMTDFETHPAGTADLKARVNDALVGVTPGPWSLCAHLHRDEVDEGCSCGYRGVVFGPEDFAMAVCQPGHDPAPAGEEGTEPQRYGRATERQNARFIAAARDLMPELMTHIEQLEAALTRANAATAAAYEVAAREVDDNLIEVTK